jgi:hypothetical protein
MAGCFTFIGSAVVSLFKSRFKRNFCHHKEVADYFANRNVLFPNGQAWFNDLQQTVSSSASNNLEEDWMEWKSPPIYPSNDNFLPDIVDNTEGITAFADLKIPASTKILLDIGGGKFDSSKLWLENRYSIQVYVVDPFCRSKEHNLEVQDVIMKKGGADIVTSMSVLNVVDTIQSRLRHCAVAWEALKPNGVAYFKVWAGSYPRRGSGVGVSDPFRKVYQANRWASEFKGEVGFIFGDANVFVDNNKNLLIAVKK